VDVVQQIQSPRQTTTWHNVSITKKSSIRTSSTTKNRPKTKNNQTLSKPKMPDDMAGNEIDAARLCSAASNDSRTAEHSYTNSTCWFDGKLQTMC
jgi:hypothetical protein